MSSEALSADAVYSQPGGRSQNVACRRASSSTIAAAWSLSSGCKVSGISQLSAARSSSTSTKRPVSGSNADPYALGKPFSSGASWL